MSACLKDINVSVVAGRVDAGPAVCRVDRQTLDGFGVSLSNNTVIIDFTILNYLLNQLMTFILMHDFMYKNF